MVETASWNMNIRVSWFILPSPSLSSPPHEFVKVEATNWSPSIAHPLRLIVSYFCLLNAFRRIKTHLIILSSERLIPSEECDKALVDEKHVTLPRATGQRSVTRHTHTQAHVIIEKVQWEGEREEGGSVGYLVPPDLMIHKCWVCDGCETHESSLHNGDGRKFYFRCQEVSR